MYSACSFLKKACIARPVRPAPCAPRATRRAPVAEGRATDLGERRVGGLGGLAGALGRRRLPQGEHQHEAHPSVGYVPCSDRRPLLSSREGFALGTLREQGGVGRQPRTS
jgi:hypothetical protein